MLNGEDRGLERAPDAEDDREYDNVGRGLPLELGDYDCSEYNNDQHAAPVRHELDVVCGVSEDEKCE